MAEPLRRLERIEVTGIVQGVGFRPFVHNLAQAHGLAGYVLNNPDGVVIEVEGASDELEAFAADLREQAPPLSHIVDVHREVLKESALDGERPLRYESFEIRASEHEGKPVTLISPDACVCDDCLRELFDPGDRRYLYPFINCTNCGPRFSIIQSLPYDRPFTTMSKFKMCPACQREYDDPSDRRFHAQPNACPVCGPALQLVDAKGHPLPDDPLLETIALLKEGRIVAIKGLGGFHLAVDATNETAVERLRRRKRREEKPLALMVGSVAMASELVRLTPSGEELLTSMARPILLSARRDSDTDGVRVADAVAPDNPYLGVMLPYTPMHYLLFFHPQAGGDFADGKPIFLALVMTSGNLSEEPICKDNDEAIERLSGVADAFLVHDRDIHVRSDDSVVSLVGDELSLMRRSRGYAPLPVFLPEAVPQVLALGGELKNTLCLTEGRRAFLSQHIGDLENVPTLGFFQEAVAHFTKILDLSPTIFAYDLHPEYLSTKYFAQMWNELDENSFGAVGVQHHHAHIASVLAEHGRDEPVIGFSLDGTGYGLDGAIWGGEVLLCTPESFSRFAHLDYVPLLGGSKAIREPWRMAFSHLRSAFGDEWSSLDLPCLHQVSSRDLELLKKACDAGLNSPPTSSLGRLFDAVASILNLRQRVRFEGQAALMLEMLATGAQASAMPFSIREEAPQKIGGYPVLWGNVRSAVPPSAPSAPVRLVLDFSPSVRAIAEGVLHRRPFKQLAASFHATLLAAFLEAAKRARESTGIKTVALSGGCWQNRILSERFPPLLRENGFEVLAHRLVPPNDGGLSLGQAYTAARIAQLTRRSS